MQKKHPVKTMPENRQQLPVIGITMGDPVGIGPEIIVKALATP